MKKVKANILVIDDDPDVRHTARIVLKSQFSDIQVEGNPQQINYLINHYDYDVILLDMNYKAGVTSGKEGLFWLKSILDKKPDQQVIMITAYGDIKLAVEAMKIGAADFVVKPWENEKLQATVYSAYNHSRSKVELEKLKSHQNSLSRMLATPDSEIIGQSPAMREIFRLVDKVGPTDANVLVTGENGTGKELIAKAIHHKSLRSNQVFIKVDLGAIAETLFESELFGHKKGAFTDAKEDRTGRFELANKGTLFLDEIGNLSLPMQAKLLTAIQTKEVIRLGENTNIPIDCRIISATNSQLNDMVEEKMFRTDLLYRLNTVEIKLPALRDRKEDIPLLSKHYLQLFVRKYRKSNLTFTDGLLNYLSSYPWPGNIRELQHAVERAVIMTENTVLEKGDFLLDEKPLPVQTADTYKLDEMEKVAIEQVIRKHQGNISKAAKELGLGRTTIYRKLEKYGIRY